MKKALEVSVVLSAVDRMNSAIDKATNQGIAKLERFQTRANNISSKAFAFGRDAGAAGIAMAAPIVYATKKAVEFEKELANVAKVTDVAIGSVDFKAMGNEVSDMAIYLGRTNTEAAKLYAGLAQGGVARAELGKVGRIAGEMAVAFDMDLGIASQQFIKMNNAMAETVDQSRLTVDAMNHLSNKVATTGSNLMEFMFAGGAGVGRRLGISGKDMSAIGAVFDQIGISMAEAATIMERAEKGVRGNELMRGIFEGAGGGLKGFLKVLEVGSKLKGANQFEFFSKFGEYGNKMAALAGNMPLLEKNLALVADTTKFAGSAQQEFNNYAQTTFFKLNQLMEKLNKLAVTLGDAFLPMLNKIMDVMTPVISAVSQWAAENPRLSSTLMTVLATAAALSLAISAVSFAYGGLWKVMAIGAAPIWKLIGGFQGLKFAVFALRYHMLFSLLPALAAAKAAFVSFTVAIYNIPVIGWILAAIAAIAAGAYLIYKNWEPIKAWFVGLWGHVSAQFTLFVTFVESIGTKMFEAGANIVKSIGDGISSQWDAFIARWEKRIQQIRDFLPFSPAKVGPLQDIHKIKLVETIAQTITPGPVLAAMQGVAGAIAGPAAARPLAVAGRSGGGIVLNYSPTVSIAGGANVREQVEALFRDHAKDLVRIFEQEIARRQRASF